MCRCNMDEKKVFVKEMFYNDDDSEIDYDHSMKTNKRLVEYFEREFEREWGTKFVSRFL